MTIYNVAPTGPGVSDPWKLERGGINIASYSSKSAAKNAAMSKASSGDTVTIHGQNGVIQQRKTL